MSSAPLPRSRRAHRSRWRALVLCVALAGSACGEGGDDRGSAASPAPAGAGTTAAAPRFTGTITVLAAASLTEAFTAMGAAFEAGHPGSEVVFSFGASSTLATQANQGAPADLFASADEADMARVTDAGNAAEPSAFARNRPAIVVGKGNPRGIHALADLGRPGVTFLLCALEVPCGRFGQEALDRAGVAARPRSYEENVKAVVTKVALGEADAGIVYATDVAAAGDSTQGVDIPAEHNVIAVYQIAVLAQAPAPEGAAAFKAFVTSVAGEAILARFGFLPAA